jgi:hypothetical protein
MATPESEGCLPPEARTGLPTPREDLRKHLRFRIDNASTSFVLKGVSTSEGAGRTSRGRAAINLSEGGTMLLVCEPIPVGTPICVRVEVEGYAEVVDAAGVVRWCEEDGRNGKDFHAGIEFIDLGDADLRKITKMREWLDSPEAQRQRSDRCREGT